MKRPPATGYGLALALALAGGLCLALVNGILGEVLGTVLIGLGAILAVSLVFMQIGRGEDEELAREEKRHRERLLKGMPKGGRDALPRRPRRPQ